jgi:hypothetical protein
LSLCVLVSIPYSTPSSPRRRPRPLPPPPQSRAFAAKASRELHIHVYAYSLFHVFFEQYLSVLYDATAMVGMPLLAVVLVAWALSGSLWSAGLLAAVLASLLVHLGGAMLVAGIQVGDGESRHSCSRNRGLSYDVARQCTATLTWGDDRTCVYGKEASQVAIIFIQ